MEHASPFSSEALARAIEALLFVHGEPISPDRIAKILSETRAGAEKVSPASVDEALQLLEERLRAQSSGLVLIRGEGEVQLATHPDMKPFVEQVVRMEMNEELTPAALETLAIIAYNGPVTRSAIDYIRGVNSSFILRTLLIRGLIDRKLQIEKANTYEYTPSMELLKHLGISNKEQLPEYKEFQEVIKAMQRTDATPSYDKIQSP
jgi:segregation and condensation protein B